MYWNIGNVAAILEHVSPIVAIEEGVWGTGSAVFHFPVPEQADYGFQTHLYEHESLQIHACLRTEPNAYFWCVDYELCSGRPIETLTDSFLHVTQRILLNSTKIEQKRGWSSWHFICFCHLGRRWDAIPGGSCALKGFDVPKIDGKSRTYYSPAVITTTDR